MLDVATGAARLMLLDGVLGPPGCGLYRWRMGVLGRPRSSDSGELVLVILRLKKLNKVIRRCTREMGREEAGIRPQGLTVLAGIEENLRRKDELR